MNPSRLPQSSGTRTTKPSKIAKPAGLNGPRSSTLPKSLSSETICLASNLVQKTANHLFPNRFGKPPESKPRTKMNIGRHTSVPAAPVGKNSTVVIASKVKDSTVVIAPRKPDSTVVVTRPTFKRSETYVRESDKAESSQPVSNVTQTMESRNNLTQDVISKLKQKTFTTTNPDRMSISPIQPLSMDSLSNRKFSNDTNSILTSPENTTRLMAVNSTPLVGNARIDKISTKYLVDQKVLPVLPPINFNITGTDLDTTAAPQTNRNISIPALHGQLVENATSHLPAKDKFNLLTQDMCKDDIIADTTLNLFTTAVNDITAQTPNRTLLTSTTMDHSTMNATVIQKTNLMDFLPTPLQEKMEVDDKESVASCSDSNLPSSAPIDMPNKQRFSFGQDITEWTLDCSIELCDSSIASSAANLGSPSHLKKQNSFEDKSLSILTPDQMKEFLDSNNTNLNLDLPLFPNKMSMHQCRIDQTPSPEELPLDPIGVKTDISDLLTGNDNTITSGQYEHEQQLSQTDSYSKTDQMTKSATSKVSNSFITSVTSITSLDTGYQGDGEMSRPASRGGDHSPSNMPRVHPMRPILGREPSFMNNNQNNIAIIRRQDPMTDSDFFTESDADDIVNRGDRRAQVIDGQLYAPMVQGANVYVNQQPSTEDSCMESSGIFTDVENRADEETVQRSNEHDSDMSPDGSTDTIKSSNTEYNNKKNSTVIQALTDTFSNHQGQSMSDSTTSTINSSCEKGGDRQSVISDDSNNSVHSIQSRGLSSGDNLQSSSFKKSTPNRKHNKNEANVALKKHEMSKRVVQSGDKLHNGSSSGALVGDIENQENKRPLSTSGCSSSRKIAPNKWDAVMNKIASNKTNVKSKNYNEVKSKVTCGLTKKDSPGLIKSPTTEDDLFVTTTKRNFQLSSKRGRTHSQQSSQSDISENVGSPKTRSTSSSSPRSAKKRDVRAISITPIDQSNAKSNGKCGNIKPVSLQKRLSNGVSPVTSPSPTEQKSSPPPKKFLTKRSSQSSSTKTPLKAGEVDLTKNGLAALLAEHGGMVPMGERIVGGDAVPITQFPWIVSMIRLGSHRCGGAVISANRILSAAHCTVGIAGNGFQIRAGSTQNNGGGQLIATTNVINHPQYNAQTLNNDICVMNLASSLGGGGGTVAIIGMPAQGAGTAAGVTVWVAGWGATCEGCAGTTGLRAVSKPVVANAQCNTMYGGGITAQMLCAGFAAGGRDACQGDSGGPLTAGNSLVGIVSWGRGCARPNLPGVYARVSSFRTWINGLL